MPRTWDHIDHDPTSLLATPSADPSMSVCLDEADGPCAGETFPRLALSGSGERYPRCDRHYDAYVARTQPVLDAIRARYPVCAPNDFDPTYAGEVWAEDDY